MNTNEYKYKTEPFAHQIDAVRFVAEHPMAFALFMEQGTGKTKTTIDIMENLYLAHRIQQVLIIAPNGVHVQWGRTDANNPGEIEKHSFSPHETFIWKSDKKHTAIFTALANKPPVNKLRYLCVNTEAFGINTYIALFAAIIKSCPTFLVVDEATAIKNPEANRTMNIIYGLSHTVKTGRRIRDYTPYSTGRCILTGTPTAKGPYGLWSMCEFVQKGFWGMNYYAFKSTFGIERKVVYPGVAFPISKALTLDDFVRIRKLNKEEHMDALEIALDMNMRAEDVAYILAHPDVNAPYKNTDFLKAKLATLAFTVRKKDCLDLPEKLYEVRKVAMNADQKRIYKELQKDAYTKYQNGALDAVNQAAIRVRLRQVAGGFFPAKYDLSEGVEQELLKAQNVPIGKPPKAVALEAMLEDNEGSFPVIVTCVFRAEAEYIYALLSKKYTCALIMGGIPAHAREKIVADFTANKIEVLIAVASTIAEGFNLQSASTMYLYSSDYRTEERMQLEDRIHRIGQTHACTYVDLVTEGSVDEHILAAIKGDVQFQEYMRSSDPSVFIRTL